MSAEWLPSRTARRGRLTCEHGGVGLRLIRLDAAASHGFHVTRVVRPCTQRPRQLPEAEALQAHIRISQYRLPGAQLNSDYHSKTAAVAGAGRRRKQHQL